MRAVSLIVGGEPYLLDPEEATGLAWLLRNLEALHAPDVETAAMMAAVIVEDAARGVRAGTRTLTEEEERAVLTVLEQTARNISSPRGSPASTAPSTSSTARTRLHSRSSPNIRSCSLQDTARRAADTTPAACRQRWRVQKESWNALADSARIRNSSSGRQALRVSQLSPKAFS